LIPLPYADDLRDNTSIIQAAGLQPKLNEEKHSVIDDLTKQEKHSAKLLVKNLNIDFDSRDFENPTIQKFFTGLQALALQEDEPDEVQDLLEPDYEGMSKFKPVIDKFKDAFYDGEAEDPECAEKPKGAKKARARPAAKSSATSS